MQRTFFFHNFSQTALGFTRKVIGRFERRVWSDWLTYIMHIIFRLRIQFSNGKVRHFKIVSLSQRYAMLLWFLFLRFLCFCWGYFCSFISSKSWNGVYVVIRSIWRTVITVLKANGEIRSRWIEASQDTLCHKRAKCWAMIKCKW